MKCIVFLGSLFLCTPLLNASCCWWKKGRDEVRVFRAATVTVQAEVTSPSIPEKSLLAQGATPKNTTPSPSSTPSSHGSAEAFKCAEFLRDVQQQYDTIFQGKQEILYDETNMPHIKAVAEYFCNNMFAAARSGASDADLNKWVKVLLLQHTPQIFHKEMSNIEIPTPLPSPSRHDPRHSTVPSEAPRLSDALSDVVKNNPGYNNLGPRKSYQSSPPSPANSIKSFVSAAGEEQPHDSKALSAAVKNHPGYDSLGVSGTSENPSPSPSPTHSIKSLATATSEEQRPSEVLQRDPLYGSFAVPGTPHSTVVHDQKRGTI